MFIAHLETATGPMTIGLIDLQQGDMEGPFNALLNTLAQVSDPIVVTSTDTAVLEAPLGTPATLTFRYLGANSTAFEDQEAFSASMNEHFARGIFQCPASFDAADDGRIAAEFEYFALIGEEAPGETVPTDH